MAFHVRAALIVLTLAAAAVRAADICPAPPKFTSTRPPDISLDDHRIHIDSDDALLSADGNAVLKGRVNVRQDERTVVADAVTYDDVTGRITVTGAVDFLDPRIGVRSDAGSYLTTGGASFDRANFQLMGRARPRLRNRRGDGAARQGLVHGCSLHHMPRRQ